MLNKLKGWQGSMWYTDVFVMCIPGYQFAFMCVFQDQIHSNHLNRMEQECAGLHEKVQYLTAQNKGLQTQLSETKRKHAESECKVRSRVISRTVTCCFPSLLCYKYMSFDYCLENRN